MGEGVVVGVAGAELVVGGVADVVVVEAGSVGGVVV